MFGDGNFFEALPEGFVANAFALTSPRDVCRLSLVCSLFRSAADWDAVWEKFLTPEYHKIMADADALPPPPAAAVRPPSKKELYLRLCDHPVIIHGGKKSFSLEKLTGKKCYMLAARDLSITWGDTPRYWRWISVPESRFTEVAELVSVCWLEVHGRLNTSILSKDTRYVAYLVYKSTPNAYGFDNQHVEVSIGFDGVESQTKMVFLDPEVLQRRRYRHAVAGRRLGIMNRGIRSGNHRNHPNTFPSINGPRQRKDGWLEIELGEFYNEEGKEGELEMNVMEVKGGNWKGGLIVQGLEVRPKIN